MISNFSLRYKYIFKQKDDEKKEKHQLGDISVVFSVVLVAHFHQILHHQHDLVGNTQNQNHHVTNNNYEGHKQLILFALL